MITITFTDENKNGSSETLSPRQIAYLCSALHEIEETYSPEKDDEPWSMSGDELNDDEFQDLKKSIRLMDMRENPEDYSEASADEETDDNPEGDDDEDDDDNDYDEPPANGW